MTLPIERARTKRPVTWLTIIGVLMLPVVIGGILVAALYNPTERLGELNAAIVNNDEPVTIDDQLVPLGRQLTAGLVEGTGDDDENLTWTISNAEDAKSGLADGTYAAVITIPENFSAAATSTAPGGTPERATIKVTTPPDSLVVDDAITAQVASTATSVLGEQLSTTYLENVFVGFTDLGTQLGTAADGAAKLADGAQQAADGAAALPDGAAKLATGATDIADGATQLGSGLDEIAGGTSASAAGASALAGGLRDAAAKVNNQELVGAAKLSASNASDAAKQTKDLAAEVGGLAYALGPDGLLGQCIASDASQAFCAELGKVAAAAGDAAGHAVTAATSAGTASGYAQPTAAGISELTTGTSAGLTEAAGKTDELAAGLTQLANGTTQSADGARALGDGATQLGSGADQLATGAGTLATGVQSLADGTDELATGLRTASAAVPSYTDSEAQSLASVVADPVKADGTGSSLFGASAIPLLATLALWFGGLATFVVLQAVSRRALTSRAPSAMLALRGFAPAAALGALQGVLVAGVVQVAASYDVGEWLVFASVCLAAGVAFAAVNQGLVAVFSGAGRWISALVGVLAVATGVVSTVPGPLADLAALMPTAPAYNGMVSALTSTSGVGAAFVGLAIWAVLSFGATTIAVARRRTTSVRALLSAAPAGA
ncbi:putative membrane protein [Agromyces sp. CF514]|uniref:YhgE/Pip domain-containing protein n=1 Tax=Agromyces sp. CF514 TaxID=1881031 RepID=UPI0008F31F90|nr:YhgE/Pip family protein [Agromyces sp. CF514]SFR82521.1 putative membrane protein [Agromyces sp. CF514]